MVEVAKAAARVQGYRGCLQRGLTAPLSNLPPAKFASQGDPHVRTDAQIKFLYYPLMYRVSFLVLFHAKWSTLYFNNYDIESYVKKGQEG